MNCCDYWKKLRRGKLTEVMENHPRTGKVLFATQKLAGNCACHKNLAEDHRLWSQAPHYASDSRAGDERYPSVAPVSCRLSRRRPAAAHVRRTAVGMVSETDFLRVLRGRSPRSQRFKKLTRSSMGRIRRHSTIQIHIQALRGRGRRRITVSVAMVIRAMRGHILTPRRLRELPYFRKINSALHGGRRRPEVTPRRRRASIVDRPVDNLARPGALPDIFRCHNFLLIRRGHARAINSCLISRSRDSVYPRIDVSLLFRQHAPALFLIEKDNRSPRKSFSACCPSGQQRVGSTQSLCVGHRLQFGVQPSIEQDEKTKSDCLDRRPMSCPVVRRSTRRIIQPVSAVRKSLSQNLQVRVAGIFIAIKPEVGGILPMQPAETE